MDDLSRIRVLFLDPNLGLWGIPYGMRRDVGQAPRDLYRAGNTKGWIYLGHPGWYGSMSNERVKEVKEFLAPIKKRGLLPGNAYEWTYTTVRRRKRR